LSERAEQDVNRGIIRGYQGDNRSRALAANRALAAFRGR
jgi:hypothetical protein